MRSLAAVYAVNGTIQTSDRRQRKQTLLTIATASDLD
jgi:hypothetical protein